MPTIVIHVFQSVWFLVRVILVAATVLAFAGGIYLLSHLDDEIRQHAEEVLSQHFSSLQVNVRSARRIGDRGLVLRGISFRSPYAGAGPAELITIDEISVTCPASVQQLIRERPQIRHVTIRGMTLTVTQRPDGTYDLDELVRSLRFGETAADIPTVAIEDSTLIFSNLVTDGVENPSIHDLQLAISPLVRVSDSSVPAWQISGTAASNYCRRMEINGEIDANSVWNLNGKIDGLLVSPELRATAPREWIRRLESFGALRGRAELEFRLASNGGQNEPPSFRVKGTLSQGYLNDARLPFPLTDLQADVDCDQHGLSITNFRAHGGRALLLLDLRRDGWSDSSPLLLTGEAQGLQLDTNVAQAFPPAWREIWTKFLPAGVVDARIQLEFDGKTWRPKLKLQCLNVSFTYHKFPYRLHGCTGVVDLQPSKENRPRAELVRGQSVISDKFPKSQSPGNTWATSFQESSVTFDLKALASGQMVQLQGDIVRPGPDFSGWIDVKSSEPVPINQALLDALKPQVRRVVESLNPRGALSFHSRIKKDGPRQGRPDHHLVVALNRCSMRYEKFPYPLDDVRGILELDNSGWTFRELEARNDTGYVRGHGIWQPEVEGGKLQLDFAAKDIPLEDELRDALTPGSRKLWERLRPRGTIDHLKIGMTIWPARKKKSIHLVLRKWPREQNVEGRDIALIPEWLPYRLEEVTGTLEYRDGHVTWDKIRAHHNGAQFAFGGEWQVQRDGRWQLLLDKLNVDRLPVDRDLISALPHRIRGILNQLKLTQSVCANGHVILSGQPAGQTTANWDLQLDLAGGSLDFGCQFDHVHGGLRLAGGFDNRGLRSEGELLIDSCIYKDIQVTNVHGPIWIDNSQVILGNRVEGQASGKLPQPITATTLGGTVYGDAQIALTEDMPFRLNLSLTGGDLGQIAREVNLQQKSLSGNAFAVVQLEGTKQGSHTLRGDGAIRLRDADIYELPLMVSLLNILSIRPPDRTAFTTSDIKFRIEGEHIHFRQADFNGDTISLKGDGWMNLDREINLNFYTIVGSDKYPIPIVSPLLGKASRQFMVIHVTGTVDAPETSREAFPSLNERFQQLFPEEVNRQAEKTSKRVLKSFPTRRTRR